MSFKKLKKPQQDTLYTLYTVSQYATIGDTVKTRYYSAETEKLRDSIEYMETEWRGSIPLNIIWA
ncbi:MAG: hypothetical protein IPF69_06670 [Chitinophagaceae bacterium]|nr:hypothetical protein [Chitinophagaceae bacterium]